MRDFAYTPEPDDEQDQTNLTAYACLTDQDYLDRKKFGLTR